METIKYYVGTTAGYVGNAVSCTGSCIGSFFSTITEFIANKFNNFYRLLKK